MAVMRLLVFVCALRYCQKTLPRPRAIATRKIALATTFTCGGTETRAMPQTKIGNVCVAPALKYVITKSSMESANPSSAAASIAGAISGSVTLRKVVTSFAPRSIAASSRWRSNPIRRAFTVTTTKLTMNITCAMKIVTNPSWKIAVVFRKSVRSDAPSTISGVAIGRKMSTFVAPRPTKRCRTIAMRDERAERGRDDRRDAGRPRAT